MSATLEVPSVSSTPAGSDDAELVAAVASALRFARYLCGDRVVAEDVTSAALARALPRLRSGRVDDPGAYLRRAVVNELRNWRRRQGYERAILSRLTPTASCSAGTDAVDDRAAVRELLAELPVRQRATLVLRFLEDRSVTDVAAILRVSEGTVKSQTSKALDVLRRRLEDGTV